MTIGILALQGGYALHERKFRELHVNTKRVFDPGDFDGIDGLVVPGGESSTMLKTGTLELWGRLQSFAKTHPVWGTCAGAILIAAEVQNPAQPSLGLMDITVQRNAYGCHNESFIAISSFRFAAQTEFECVFIRAPKIVRVGQKVSVIGAYDDLPIMVEQGRHLSSTFHPELSPHLDIHRYFLAKVSAA